MHLFQVHNMSGKFEIQWTPLNDKFITWGSELRLYEICPTDENNVKRNIKLSELNYAKLIATLSNHLYVKSVDIYPKVQEDILVAVGLPNGRVSLSTFGTDYDSFAGKELVPKHCRQCNVVKFNTIDPNLIAAGLEKYRSDHSILIWDIKQAPKSGKSSTGSTSSTPTVETVKPLAEFGHADVAHSLDWFNATNKLLVGGMSGRWLKMFDLRDSNKMVSQTSTKAVYGVCVSPHDDKHLASYLDTQTSIWDVRNFEKPLIVMPHTKTVCKIAWCPTRYNVLGVLQKESPSLGLYDVQHINVGNEEIEPSVSERIVTPSGQSHIITSFAWHPNDRNRFLTVAASGSIKEYTVFDRITLTWSSTSSLVWTYGRKSLKYVSDPNIPDVSTEMIERAQKGYGLEEEVQENAAMVDKNEVLSNVWHWLHLSGKLNDEGVGGECPDKHPGVLSVLNIDPNTNPSELVTISWSELGYPNCQGSAKYYRHEDRSKAMSLCSWPMDRDQESLTKYLDNLEREQAFSRAAAIAVFNLKIKLAIEVLSRAPNTSDAGSSLNVVAMALAGFSDDKNSVWRQFCSTSKAKLSDPYLKTMFAFLTTENFNYDTILNDTGITVDDRVAFACMFLPDSELNDYLKTLNDTLIKEGNLDGLLLTGNNREGLKLLQRYLDSTGDIQSATLIAVRGFSEDLHLEVLRDWIDCYRILLDTWQLWYHRADFDVMLSTYRPSEKPPQQVYVSCNFCGKSISAYLHGINRGRGPFTRLGGSSTNKLTSCPNCRKPLPRCSICLMFMGTSVDDDKGAEFNTWFTWCQTCRHGGHAGHLTDWFEDHQECPVTGCTCKCLAADSL